MTFSPFRKFRLGQVNMSDEPCQFPNRVKREDLPTLAVWREGMHKVMFIALITIALSSYGCQKKYVIQLSASDVERGYAILEREDQLLTEVASALDSYAKGEPDSASRLLRAQAECKDFLNISAAYVREMFEKYQVSERQYRLDVFHGQLVRLTEKAVRDNYSEKQ
jgi:hypothetical protein